MMADINKTVINGEAGWLPSGAYRDRAYNALRYDFPEMPVASIDLSWLIEMNASHEMIETFAISRLREINIMPESVTYTTDEYGDLNWIIQ